MRAGLLLLLFGMAAASGAALLWRFTCLPGFWHFAGGHGFTILLLVVVFALILDNRRLRRQLRERTGARTDRSEPPQEGR